MWFHFFDGSYTILNYLVDIVILIGAVFSGMKWNQKHQKNRQKKKDDKASEIIDAKVECAVDVAMTRLLVKVDDKVEKSVKTELSDISAKLDNGLAKIEEVHAETHRNGGSSMKDSQERTEAAVSKLINGQATILEGMAATKVILRNQDEKIADIGKHQDENSDVLTQLGLSLATHLGAHQGLPQKGDTGSTGT